MNSWCCFRVYLCFVVSSVTRFFFRRTRARTPKNREFTRAHFLLHFWTFQRPKFWPKMFEISHKFWEKSSKNELGWVRLLLFCWKMSKTRCAGKEKGLKPARARAPRRNFSYPRQKAKNREIRGKPHNLVTLVTLRPCRCSSSSWDKVKKVPFRGLLSTKWIKAKL